MAVVEVPYVPIHEVDPPHIEGVSCTKRELMSTLFALANNKPGFQKGKLDRVAFELEEGDRVDDFEDPGPVESITYAYEAERSRSPGMRPVVDFSWSITNRVSNLPLPPHIAAKVYAPKQPRDELVAVQDTLVSPSPEQWMALFGDSFTHEIKYEYGITNDDGCWELQAAEVHTYKDESGNAVHSVSNILEDDDGMAYLSFDTETQSMTDVPRQYPTPDFLARCNHAADKLKFGTEEELREFWGNYVLLEEAIGYQDKADEQAELNLAYGVLLCARRALLIQAGIHKIGGTVLLDALV